MTRGPSTSDRTNGHGSDSRGSDKSARAGKSDASKGSKEAAAAAGKGRDRKEVQQLIELGKSKGQLTYDEIADALPADLSSSDQMDELVGILGDEDIEIVESPPPAAKASSKRSSSESGGEQEKKLVPVAEEDGETDFNDAYASKSNDPVRMYLRKMGSVSLLTREGEVEIAKRIEDGENAVLDSILQSPIAVQEILKLGEKVRVGKLRLKDVVRDSDDEEGYNEEEVKKRVLRLTEKVKKLWLHKDEQEQEIAENKKLSETKRRAMQEEVAKTQREMVDSLTELRLNKKQIENVVQQLKRLIDQLERAEAPVSEAAKRFGMEPRELKKQLRALE